MHEREDGGVGADAERQRENYRQGEARGLAELAERMADVLQVETGSLYPALHRLERQGWVKAEWKKSESNQRAKYYTITKLGKAQLASDYERWGRMVATIEAIMTAK